MDLKRVQRAEKFFLPENGGVGKYFVKMAFEKKGVRKLSDVSEKVLTYYDISKIKKHREYFHQVALDCLKRAFCRYFLRLKKAG